MGADSAVERVARFVDSETGLLKSLEEGDARHYYAMHVIVGSQKRIAEYARDIAETVLDLTVERMIRDEDFLMPKAVSST